MFLCFSYCCSFPFHPPSQQEQIAREWGRYQCSGSLYLEIIFCPSSTLSLSSSSLLISSFSLHQTSAFLLHQRPKSQLVWPCPCSPAWVCLCMCLCVWLSVRAVVCMCAYSTWSVCVCVCLCGVCLRLTLFPVPVLVVMLLATPTPGSQVGRTGDEDGKIDRKNRLRSEIFLERNVEGRTSFTEEDKWERDRERLKERDIGVK